MKSKGKESKKVTKEPKAKSEKGLKSWLKGLSSGKVFVIMMVAIFGILLTYIAFLGVSGRGSIPEDLRVTNVTDNSATLVWVTNKREVGLVAYQREDKWKPFVNSNDYSFGYDDRDVTMSADRGEVVSRLGKYYLHHVTLRGLESGAEYSYRIVYGLKPINKLEYPKLVVAASANATRSPIVVQGGAIANFSYGNLTNDGVVLVTVTDFETGKVSTPISSVLDDRGRYAVDLTNVRSKEGFSDFGEINSYDKVNILVIGNNAQGKGEIDDIVANGSSLPTILMLSNKSLASRVPANTGSYAMSVGNVNTVGGVNGSVLGASCECPDGYRANNEGDLCWSTVNSGESTGCESGGEEPKSDDTKDTGGTTNPKPTVEEVQKGHAGQYCEGSDLCYCEIKNGVVECNDCKPCANGCSNNDAGTAASCNKAPTNGGGGKATSKEGYGTGGEMPKVGAATCTDGEVKYKSDELHCDTTNKFKVSVDGKEIEYYPQVWQEVVYQCITNAEGKTEWISFNKTGRLTGDVCEGTEKNWDKVSEEDRKKIDELKKDKAAVAKASEQFKSTCSAGSYDYVEEKNGKTCNVHVDQKADCSWSLSSSDCGYSVTSEDVDPGKGTAAGEKKVDPAIATKIANMMTEQQCKDLIAGVPEAEKVNYHYLGHPDFPNQGYCYYGTVAGVGEGSCDPLDKDSCHVIENGVKQVCRYFISVYSDSSMLGKWNCAPGGGDGLNCNPFSKDEDQCPPEASICLIVKNDATTPAWESASLCQKINESFRKPIVTAKDLEDFLNVKPATPGMTDEQLAKLQSTAGMVEFRTSDSKVDYFKSVGLLTSEVKGVFDAVCNRGMDEANSELCNVLVGEKMIKKFNVLEGVKLTQEDIGLVKQADCGEGFKWIVSDVDKTYGYCIETAKVSGDCRIDNKKCSNEGDKCLMAYNYPKNIVEFQCKPTTDKPVWRVRDGLDLYICDPLGKVSGCGKGDSCVIGTRSDIEGHPGDLTFAYCTDELWKYRVGMEQIQIATINGNVDVPMVKASECKENEKFVTVDGDQGYCGILNHFPSEVCNRNIAAYSNFNNGGPTYIDCQDVYPAADSEYADSTQLYDSTGQPISAVHPRFEKDEDGNYTVICSQGTPQMLGIKLGSYVVSSSNSSRLVCIVEDKATGGQSSSPTRDLMKSAAYAGGGLDLNNNSGLGKAAILGASTISSFEIIDGKLILINAGLYDLDMKNKNIVAPKIQVDEGVTNAMIEFYFDLNENGVKDPMEPNVDAGYLGVSVKSDKVSRVYDVRKGWNLLAFPLLVKDNMKAKDVFELFSNNNLQLKDLAVYRSGKWFVYSYDNLKGYFGTNFDIAQSEGFFVNSKDTGKFVLTGKEYTSGLPMYLNTGWNLVGVTGTKASYTGQSFLKKLNEIKVGNELQFRASQMLRFGKSGKFDLTVVDPITGDAKGVNGIDKVDDREGYFVKVDKGTGVFKP